MRMNLLPVRRYAGPTPASLPRRTRPAFRLLDAPREWAFVGAPWPRTAVRRYLAPCLRIVGLAFALGTLSVAATPAEAGPVRISKKKPKKKNTQSPRFKHDGTQISYEYVIPSKDEKGVTICNADGKKCKNVEPDTGASASGFDGSLPPVRELAWHPQGRDYVYGSTGGKSTLNIYMEGEGCLTCEKSFGYGNKIHPAWSSDGKYLAFAVQDPTTEHGEVYLVDIYNLEEGPKKLTNHDDDTSYQPRFAPKGRALVFTRFNPETSANDLYILDDFMKPKSIRRLTKDKKAQDLNASWSPDGTKIAFYRVTTRKKKTHTDLYIVPADGSTKPTLLFKGVVKPDLNNPVWSADGAKVIFVRDHSKQHNPIAWVSIENPKDMGNLDTGTVQNSDLAGIPAAEGAIRLLWTAQGLKKDKEKRWRKVYTNSFPLK